MDFKVGSVVSDGGNRSQVAPVIVGGDGWAGRWLGAAQALLHDAEPVLHLACAAAVRKGLLVLVGFSGREKG